jgi:ABC-type lipoprotein release transport system permease subunit
MTDSSVVKLFLTEAGIIGFIGSIIGIIVSIPFIYYLIYHGVDYTDMIEKTGVNNFGYRVLGIFKAAWNFPTMFGSIIVVSFISSLTAFFPSMRAIKIKIVEALRFE